MSGKGTTREDSMKRLIVLLALLIAVAFAAIPAGAGSSESFRDSERGQKFEFALIGDMPYSPELEARYEDLIDEINDERTAFTIHVGDIKSGSSRCDDSVYNKELERFDTFERPLVYTPGDNEWTDCHRPDAGGFDSLERLAFLRSVFFADPSHSQGERELRVDFQSPDYPENARWQYGQVTFATVHVVGSNNNLGRTPENDQEYAARNQANLQWLEETFDEAVAKQSAGVLVATQANVFEDNTAEPSGFDEFVTALEAETVEFGKPVVLVHGDSHYFRIDKPLPVGDTQAPRVLNFTRVEVFGSANVHWVRGAIDVRDPEVFSFDQEIVADTL